MSEEEEREKEENLIRAIGVALLLGEHEAGGPHGRITYRELKTEEARDDEDLEED